MTEQSRPRPGGVPSGFDPKAINPLDWAIMAISLLVLVPFSFFGYVSVDSDYYGGSIGAWHFGDWTFLTFFAMVLAVAGGALVALGLFVPQLRLPAPARLAGLGSFTASAVLYVIAIFLHPDFVDTPVVSVGHGFSFWLSLVLAIVGTVLSLMRLQATGGTLPSQLQGRVPNLGGYGPQGGAVGGSTVRR